jgi:hypothetical protein
MKSKVIISAGDAAEDGHPCEAALAFRNVAIRSNIADEIPADVLDMAIQFAWIGKAISRTMALNEWCLAGIDPNTREIVAAMALDSETRQVALNHALKAKAIIGLESGLASIRRSSAFIHASKIVLSVCGARPSVADISKLAFLSSVASQLPDTRRIKFGQAQDTVVSLEAFRKIRKITH